MPKDWTDVPPHLEGAAAYREAWLDVAAVARGAKAENERLVDRATSESILRTDAQREAVRGMREDGWVPPTAPLGEHIASWLDGVSRRLGRMRR